MSTIQREIGLGDGRTAPRADPSSVRLAVAASPGDALLVEGLRDGDEASFAALLDRYQGSMLRVAELYVADRSAAEDVVQETWVAVIRGIDRFDGRSSVNTWLFRILTNRAKTMGQRAARVIPISSLVDGAGSEEQAAGASGFFDADHRCAGHWCGPLEELAPDPDGRAATARAVEIVLQTIRSLPPSQRMVITLRDVECRGSKDVCELLGLTDTNQRVLLHRARARVRRRLEEHDAHTREP